ncbi:CinA family protein [Nocardioides daphniae]|uniref:CinA family protein n=1 Tax=Nocardioides daphniae TaxID=402297 RepID=A0A4P7UBF1_9ACTN|nr:CinA family protein [Nocardioides daphniae]QCC77463.1 CinA family protein [Nocardioides daphniae]GGD31801.1 competence damage-inducible protein A [Nocardioides daphniae]
MESSPIDAELTDRAAEVVAELVGAGATLAAAESLTGGQVAAAVTGVPGASRTFVGGVVSYATRVKVDVLGVPSDVVVHHGVVSSPCAEAMAEGVRSLLATTYGVATTGVAGPDEQEGKAAGTVHVAVASPEGVVSRQLALDGGRPEIQRATVEAVLDLLLGILRREEPAVG